MTSSPTHTLLSALRIGATLSAVHQRAYASGDSTLCLPIGCLLPGHALKNQPSILLELENAIAVIENIFMPLARSISPCSQLITADPFARRLCECAGSVSTQRNSLGIVAVEVLFNEMADVSQVRPSAGSPFLDVALCGYLLILREFIHHLAFGDVIVEAKDAPTASRNQ